MEAHKKKFNLSASLFSGAKLKKATTVIRERGGKAYTIGESGEKIYDDNKHLDLKKEQKKRKKAQSQYIYDEEKKLWSIDRNRTFAGLPLQNTLKIVSYNVWFVKKNWEVRTDALCEILESIEPHVICLQEVTERALQRILTKPWLFGKYAISDKSGLTFLGGSFRYGVVILTKIKIKTLQFQSFPTNMNRRCLQSQLSFDDDEIFTISTSHLESLEFNELRCQQLDIIFEEHEKYQNMIFCGDTNYGDESPDEPTHIPNEFIDAYRVLSSDDTGYTCGEMRLDKLFLKSNIWKVSDFQIIGTEPCVAPDVAPEAKKAMASVLSSIRSIPKSKVEEKEEKLDVAAEVEKRQLEGREILTPSDHFGIFVTLTRNFTEGEN